MDEDQDKDQDQDQDQEAQEPRPPVRTRRRPRALSVGYCKPPLHTRFKPGQSGNPRGRPKAARGLRTIVRNALDEKVSIRTNGKERRVTRLEALVLKQVELASKGDPRVLEKLIQLYRSLVPEHEPLAVEGHELTQTDEEVLAELAGIFGGKGPGKASR